MIDVAIGNYAFNVKSNIIIVHSILQDFYLLQNVAVSLETRSLLFALVRFVFIGAR